MTTSQKIMIVVLVLGILVLGFFIYRVQKAPLVVGEPVINTPVNNTNTPSTNTPINNVPGTNTPTVTTPAFSFAETLLNENPGANATQEQLKTWSAKVASYSVETSSVDVASCNPNPVVAKVTLKKPILFTNVDTVSHRLVNGDITIDVPAQGSKSVAPAFAGPGIYGYSCDTRITGIFLVMP